jgi:ABC-type oligopeptide transport system substrate-binding subunit
MFASWEIPTNAQPYGVNASGYSSVEYDAACKQLLLSIPEMQVFEEASLATQRLFNSDLPAVPLFRPRRWAASEIELCGLSPDSLATSLLWNVEMLDSGDACP